MDPIEKRELKRKAWMRLATQRRRAGELRGRVVVISLICFAVLWGVVFAQMATGNDPVLSGKEKAVATRSATSPRKEIETTDPRELESERATNSKARARESEAELEAEVDSQPELEVEPEVEELEAEPEVEEFVEAEPEFVEEEPLVTSQS
jgi:cytoskeletal protein RodZ